MKKYKQKLALALAVVFTLSMPFSITTYGKNVKDLKNQQSTIKSNTKQATELLNKTAEEKRAVLSEVETIDEQLEEVSNELILINDELEKTTALLEITEQELKDAEAERERQYEILKERLRFMYVNSKVGYIDILFQATSLSDFLNRMDYITRIYEYDQEILDKLTEIEENINTMLQETTDHKNEIQALQLAQTSKMQLLEETLAEKKQIVKKLDADEQKYKNQIEQLQAANVAVEKMIKNALAEQAKLASSKQQAVYTGGKIAWPIPSSSNITSPYGPRKNPINGRGENHTGIDVSAKVGASIVAAEGGTVIYSGVMNGYGYVVIIDHGNSLSTLYAHNSKLLVEKGQKVNRGDVISKAGSTGYSTGPHLHFEVRVNGVATNPIPYVK